MLTKTKRIYDISLHTSLQYRLTQKIKIDTTYNRTARIIVQANRGDEEHNGLWQTDRPVESCISSCFCVYTYCTPFYKCRVCSLKTCTTGHLSRKCSCSSTSVLHNFQVLCSWGVFGRVYLLSSMWRVRQPAISPATTLLTLTESPYLT